MFHIIQISYCCKEKKNPVPLTWVNCSSNDSSQRVPGPVIKPVMEFIKSLLSQEPGGTIIKVPAARQWRTVSASPRTQAFAPVCSESGSSGYTTEELLITPIKVSLVPTSIWSRKNHFTLPQVSSFAAPCLSQLKRCFSHKEMQLEAN